MAIARRQALSAFREDPFVLRFRARGYDLSGAVMAFAVRLYPNAEGEALIQLGLTTTRGAAGIRVVATGSEAGVPWTDVEIVGPKDLIAALPFTGEAGADDTFAYDFEWQRADEGAGFSQQQATILYGDFIVRGSVNNG